LRGAPQQGRARALEDGEVLIIDNDNLRSTTDDANSAKLHARIHPRRVGLLEVDSIDVV